MSLRRVTFALPADDPASAVIAAWLDGLPPRGDIAPLLRQALANGIAATQMLERIEAKLDALAGGTMVLQTLPSPALDTAERVLLEEMLEF